MSCSYINIYLEKTCNIRRLRSFYNNKKHLYRGLVRGIERIQGTLFDYPSSSHLVSSLHAQIKLIQITFNLKNFLNNLKVVLIHYRLQQ